MGMSQHPTVQEDHPATAEMRSCSEGEPMKKTTPEPRRRRRPPLRRQEVRTSRPGGRQRRSQRRTAEAEPTGGGGDRRPRQAAMTANGSTPATAGSDSRLAADEGLTPRSDGRRLDSVHCHKIRPQLAADNEDGVERWTAEDRDGGNGPLRATPAAETSRTVNRRRRRPHGRRARQRKTNRDEQRSSGGDEDGKAQIWRPTTRSGGRRPDPADNGLHNGGDRATRDENDLRDGGDGHNGLHVSTTMETSVRDHLTEISK
ncbi:hypothetical protein GUJ93_ZPchr0005g15411 [Zizania palustris]|uniref:Uncharacterized protein n=1 Tax=Zizania palustris TaxID=103762 RepID=A0A8J5W229_ZIZPA|nr:hypothetical protein GUJ93_ZPchr0005g15411 [Zizania palustris]